MNRDKKGEKSGFFQHFSLRRKTINEPPSSRTQSGEEGATPTHHGGSLSAQHAPSPSGSSSWSSTASASTGATPTTAKYNTFRDRASTDITISVDDSAASNTQPRPQMSRLQRASSMIRRGNATTRKTREETAIEMFCRGSEENNISLTSTTGKEEKKKGRGFFGSKDKDDGGLDATGSDKRRSLTIKASKMEEGMFRRGEPGYFIKELKKNSTTSSSSSKRAARGNRQLETLGELKEQLREANEGWVQEFVREPFRGVLVLLEAIHEKQRKQQTGIDLSVQAACLECLRALANTAAGLAQLMNAAATKRVAALLASRDTQIKGAALELLSFVCLVPPKGVPLVLEAMSHYRAEHREPTRFHSLLQAMRAEDKNVGFLINALFFINSIVNSPEDLKVRHDLRKEFINLGLLDTIRSFKDTWAISSSELKTQLKVFEEEMQHDAQEERRMGAAKASAVDKNNPEDIFSVVLRQVKDSPYYQSFINAMGNMLQLSSTNAGQQSWEVVESMLSQYLSLADREGATEVEVMLLQDLEELKHKHERKMRNLNNRVRRAQGENAELLEQIEKLQAGVRVEQNVRLKEDISRALSSGMGMGAPGLMTGAGGGGGGGGGPAGGGGGPVGGGGGGGGPGGGGGGSGGGGSGGTGGGPGGGGGGGGGGGPAGGGGGGGGGGGKDSGTEPGKTPRELTKAMAVAALPPPLAPTVPPPGIAAPPPPGMAPPPPMGGMVGGPGRLPPKKAIHPGVKLKHLNWTKIPASQVSQSFWAGVEDDKIQFDKMEIESMFAATALSPKGPSAAGAKPSLMKPKNMLITLIDMKRANNCAIMLSRFKASFEDIHKAILTLDESVLDYEKVLKLMEFVPTKEEIDQIVDYPEEKTKLGKAEQFFWVIKDIHHYGDRLKAWAFKLKCREQMEELRPDITAVLEACEEVQKSKKFRGVLEVVLAVGNYINGGTHRGAAYGFKLDALTKLQDTKSTDNKTNLLQYLATMIAQKYPELLGFTKELKHVHQACRVSFQIVKAALEQLRRGFGQCKQAISLVSSSVYQDEHDTKFCQQMQMFVAGCQGDFNDIESDYKEMEENFEKVVERFGEPISSTPEQLFGMLHTFTTAFERVHEDNTRKAELKARQNRQGAPPGSSMLRPPPNARPPPGAPPGLPPGGKPQSIDDVVNQLRSGALFRQRRAAAGEAAPGDGDKAKDKEGEAGGSGGVENNNV